MHGSYEYILPALRGVQAGQEFYVSMCPLRLIPRLFAGNDESLEPQLRAQRTLNRARVPEIARYVLDNTRDYVFSALTASIDADVCFEPAQSGPGHGDAGRLRVPADARVVINDGQHRRAAIEMALLEKPELGYETISVVFFLDRGLRRAQQMFADLNRHAIRPASSIGVLYDHRDDKAAVTRGVVFGSDVFRDLVELEGSSLSRRSRRLFTLSAVHTANKALLTGCRGAADLLIDRAVAFWDAVAAYMDVWRRVRRGELKPAQVRARSLCSHSLVLHALGRAGNALARQAPRPTWSQRLQPLLDIDWSRDRHDLWEGRATASGQLCKSHRHVALTTNLIKRRLGLTLSDEERRLEGALQRRDA